MLSDSFMAELLDAEANDAIAAFNRYGTECFTAETRPAFIQQFVSSVWGLMANEEEAEMPKLWNLSDFLDSVGEPPPAMVEGFLPANKLICMSGNAKEGKSLVVMQILADICRGGKMLGTFPVTTSGPVVYFEMEGGPYELKERLTQRGNLDDEGYYVCVVPFDLNTAAGWGTYLSMIDDLPDKPSLVVIDTAREAFSGIRDWNDAAMVGPALKKIRNWAHKNCTVILICHNNKDKFATGVNRVSGSSALVSSTDVVAILNNQKVLDTGDLRWDYEIGGRGVRKATFKLQMDTNSLHVRVLDEEEAEKATVEDGHKGRIATKRQILEQVRTLDAFTAFGLSGAMDMTVQHTRELLNEMARDGVLAKGMKIKDEGSTRASQSYVYRKDYDDKEEEDRTVPENRASSSSSEAVNAFFDGTVEKPEEAEEEWTQG